jgi:short subunit dehydrogenase-like uncharacterized protein
VSVLIYGVTGYTGELVAREAVRRGLRPVLAARNGPAVTALASELGCEARAFGLDDPAAVYAGIEGATAVLHCAGPFVRTARPMVEACLARRASYLDITGELAVFERLLRRGEPARQAGVALLPGVGFDVVPSDCLARTLADALPDATELDLAFYSPGGSFSKGTLQTAIESLPAAGAIRRDGEIVPVGLAHATLELDFPFGRRRLVTIPWGDVATAFYTTGIRNIRVFGAPPAKPWQLRALQPLLPVLALGPIKRALQARVRRTVTGPSAHARETARVHLWGRVRNAAGKTLVARLETPEAYAFTATTAVESLRRVEAGEVEPGAWTPARAFGAGYAASFAGVTAEAPHAG